MRLSLRTLAYAALLTAGLSITAHELAGTARAVGSGNRIAWMDGAVLITEAGDLYSNSNGLTSAWTYVVNLPGLADVPVYVQGGASTNFGIVVLANGDIWKWEFGPPQVVGNVFTGPGPTAVTPQTWSEIKARFGR